MNTHEIAEIKKICIRDEPPFCSAACPLSVDIREIVKRIQNSDFKKAFKQYQKQVLFPFILSRICEKPCMEKCVRNSLGGAIQIDMLEKACVDFTENRERLSFTIPKKPKKVAIIGGGLCGMSCAVMLKNKGYEVTIFEKKDVLGGQVREYDESLLTEQEIDQEIVHTLGSDNINIVLNKHIDDITTLREMYDAVCIATGRNGDAFGILTEENGVSSISKVSFSSAKEGVFIGGSILNEDKAHKPAQSISDGIAIMKSIERYFDRVSLTAGRTEGGTCQTRLEVNLSNVRYEEAQNEDSFTRGSMIVEAGRCILCECKGCMEACDLMQRYKNFPKKIIEDINKTLVTVEMISTKVAARQIQSCNACGLCKEVCPKDLDMEDVFMSSRRILHRDGELPPAFHDFWIADMEFSNSEAAVFKATEQNQKNRYVFFPGCQLGASNPEYVKHGYQYLREKLGGDVAIHLACCGAPAQWAGRETVHAETVKKISDTWKIQGKPCYILSCPTCNKMFLNYLPHIQTVMIWNLIAEKGLPKTAASGANRTLTIYDPCSSRYNQEQQTSVRKLISNMGFSIHELDYNKDKARCCSYGGLIYNANPNLAEEIIHKRTVESQYPYVTYCTNCRDTFVKAKKQAFYLFDLFFAEELHPTGKETCSLGQRRENRLLLKEHFMESEAIMKKHAYQEINLVIDDDIKNRMEKRLILEDEIKNVIHTAETTGSKMYNQASEYFVAYLQQRMITYWVQYEYGNIKGEYIVRGVYSHRIKIGPEVK